MEDLVKEADAIVAAEIEARQNNVKLTPNSLK